MMKRIFGTIVPGLLALSLLSGTALAQTRLATVDMRKVFEGYWKTKKADAQLKERAAEMEKEHKTMLDDWKKGKEEYATLLGDANNQVLSPEERDKRKKAAEDKFKQLKETEDTIQQYERQARTTLDEQRKRMRDSILEEIKTAVSAKAKQAGFALVVDTTAETIANTPVFLYSSNENDMTKTVLDQLNLNAPSDLIKTDDKADQKAGDKKQDEKK
jgi:outer membrane protein